MRLAAIGECMVEATLDRAGPFAGPAKLGFGGDTLNTAVYARRCLPETDGRVAYVTALGDDVFSDSMLTAWRDEGLETDLVYRLAGRRPGFYAIATDEAGERRFYYWRREAAVRSLLEDSRDRDLAARLQGYDLLYLSGITLAILGDEGRGRLLALLQGLRDAGARVAFDGNHRPALWPEPAAAQDAYRAIGQLTDIALPTFDDEVALYGDSEVETTAARWLDWGAREVVGEEHLMDGARGFVRHQVEPALELAEGGVAGDLLADGAVFRETGVVAQIHPGIARHPRLAERLTGG